MESNIIAIVGIIIGFAQGVIIFLLSNIKAEVSDVWKRMNNHYHEITCGSGDCRNLKTGNVVIPRGE